MNTADGHLLDVTAGAPPPLASWEALAVDAAGNVIEFWGFKRNQGRVWAALFLRDAALTAPQLQALLDLSKGAVSMITRELEQWQVIRRVRCPNDATWRFAANADLTRMINAVLKTRELAFIQRVRVDLVAAERAAHADPTAPPEARHRLEQMRKLADIVDRALRAFLFTAQLDISGIAGVLQAARRTGGGA